MKVYVRSSTCTQDIQKFLGKDIWVKVILRYPQYYWAKIVGESAKFWYIVRLDMYDKGDYAKLKINNNKEFITRVNKDNFSLSYPIEAYTSEDIVDMLYPNPEGYSLAQRNSGEYYWHWDGERENSEFIVYDRPIGSL